MLSLILHAAFFNAASAQFSLKYSQPESSFPITELAFSTSNTAFAVSLTGILKTSDQGETWTDVSSLIPEGRGTGICFATEAIGYIGIYNHLYKTTDGGETWSLIYTFTIPDVSSEIREITFIDSNTGLVAYSNKVFKTSDGGVNWTEISGFISGNIEFKDGVLIALTVDGIVKSVDKGDSWIVVSGNISEHFQLSMVSQDIYFVISLSQITNSRLKYTFDGGLTWHEKELFDQTTGSFNQKLNFIDSNTGFLSSGGRLFKTKDGGDSWHEVFYTYDKDISGIYTLNPSVVFITATECSIYKNTTSGEVPLKAEILSLEKVQTGLVPVKYNLYDQMGDKAMIKAEYSRDNGATWKKASKGLLPDDTFNLNTYPIPLVVNISNCYHWDSYKDEVAFTDTESVLFRIIPSDADSAGIGEQISIQVENKNRRLALGAGPFIKKTRIALTSDLGSVIFEDQQSTIYKLNKYREVQWSLTFDTLFATTINSVYPGHFYAAGYSINYDNMAKTAYLFTVSNEGAVSLSATFAEREIYEIIKSNTKGAIVVSGNSSKDTIFISQLEENGNTLWEKKHHYVHYGREWQTGLISLNGNGYVIMDHYPFGYEPHIFVMGVDNNGNELWRNTSQQIYSWRVLGSSLIATGDGGFMVVGEYNSLNSGHYRIFKFNQSGTLMWVKAPEDYVNQYWEMNSIAAISEEEYLVVGNHEVYTDNIVSTKSYVFRINSSGDVLQTIALPDSLTSKAFSIAKTFDNNFAIAGNTNYYGTSSIPYHNLYFTTINSFGNSISDFQNINLIPQVTSETKFYEKVNDGFNYQIPATNAETFEIVAGTLPSGISFDQATGVLSGTFLSADESEVTLKVSNAHGFAYASLAFNVEQVLATSSLSSGYIQIYPNPAKDIITITAKGTGIIKEVTLADVYGKVIRQSISPLNNQFTLNVTELPAGIYFIRINSEAGVVTEKIKVVE